MPSLLPDWSDSPRHAPRSPSYAGLTQRAAFATWLTAKREERQISRKELARRVWPESAEMATTAQIKRYETVARNAGGRPTHVTLPSPDTLRRICDALDVPWLEAFALAGYYREILDVLVALAELGKRWLSEDNALRDEGAALSFRSIGVTQLDGKIVWDALKEERYAGRYIVGRWEEGPFEPPPGSDFEGMDARAAASFKAQCEQVSVVPCVVPKPLAVAILVATAGFPRRGDVYKDDAVAYAARLLSGATRLVETAEDLAARHRALPPLLRKADDVLKDPALPLDAKRVIAAEYMVAWADNECNRYTHIARLAAFEYFGEAGSSLKTVTPYVKLPQIRRSQLPDPVEFSNSEETKTH